MDVFTASFVPRKNMAVSIQKDCKDLFAEQKIF